MEMGAGVQPGAGADAGDGGTPEGAAGAGAGVQQPGQGTDPQSPTAGLYDLASVPQELRPFVEQELRKIEGNVTRRFQEHAEFRDKLGPLAEAEIPEGLDADGLKELFEFHAMAQNPEEFMGWLSQVNEALGISPGGELDEDAWVAMGEEKGWFAGDGNQPGGEEPGANGAGIDPEAITSQVLEQLSPHLEKIQSFEQQQEHQQAVEQAEGQFGDRLQQLIDEHGEALDVEDVIERAYAYVAQGHEDPIGAAAERSLAAAGRAQGDLVDEKLSWGSRTPGGGRPHTAPDALHHDSPDLKQAALARLKA